MHRLYVILIQLIHWLYSDNEKSFSMGGFLGAGFTASLSKTLVNINYLYWWKVIASAVIGGLVNVAIKKVLDSFSKHTGTNTGTGKGTDDTERMSK